MAWVWDPEEAEIMRQDHDDEAIESKTALGHAFKLLLETWEPKRRDSQVFDGNYELYLKSPHWRETRRRAHLRAGGQCQRCYTTEKRLDVHHLTYVRIGCEADMDLIVLCADCHGKEHQGV